MVSVWLVIVATCMSSEPDPLNIRLLESQLRTLTINVTIVTDSSTPAPSSVPGAATSSAAPAAGSSSAGSARDLSWAFRETDASCPGSVLRLARSLRSLSGSSPTERITSAYLRGREAAAIVRGDRTCYSSESVPGRRVCYVVLFCGGCSEPFITFSKNVYFAYVKTGAGATWDPEAVSHGFATQAEAEAYCRGAGLEGLPQQRDR